MTLCYRIGQILINLVLTQWLAWDLGVSKYIQSFALL